MAAAFSSSAFSPLTRLYPSIPQLALPSSSFTSQEQLKTSYAFSFRVPKYRSGLRVLSMHLESEVIASSEVTSESWNPLILKGETPVLVEFYTSWCEPCRLVHQMIDEIATDYVGKLKRVAVNVDHEPRVADEYDIKAVPIVLLFKNGEKCESVIGTMPKDFFVAAIERVLTS